MKRSKWNKKWDVAETNQELVKASEYVALRFGVKDDSVMLIFQFLERKFRSRSVLDKVINRILLQLLIPLNIQKIHQQ
jgi:hypothetical protein